MRATFMILFVTAALATSAPALAQGGGGGGAGGAAGGAAGTGAGRGAAGPSAAPSIQGPGPNTGQTNPGVSPSAPGPSSATTPPGTRPTAPQTGYAGSGPRRGGGNNAQRDDEGTREAIQELDKEIDRKLSICRGC